MFSDKGDRPGVPDLVVVLTDGKSDPGSEPLEAASEPLREQGIHVISVGLGKDIDIQELKTISTFKETGPVLIGDLQKLVTYVDSLAKEICQGMLLFCMLTVFYLLSASKCYQNLCNENNQLKI